MNDTTEIVVRVPGYAQAQLDRGDSLHLVPGLHRIVDTRCMQLVGRASDNQLHVIDEDGRLIQMDDAFYAAFATPVAEPPADEPEADVPAKAARKRKGDKTSADAPETALVSPEANEAPEEPIGDLDPGPADWQQEDS